MTVAFLTHPRFLDHVIAPGHPEQPARLDAVARGLADTDVRDGVVFAEPRPVTDAEIALVHDPAVADRIEAISAAGGGRLDADTGVNEASYEAAVLAAGTGLAAVDLLDEGSVDAAFCAVRPPGHHATPDRSMGFCLFNNVAVTAAVLAERGDRVAIVDFDAHHGNGTQDVFYGDGRVMFVSWHQYPLYPGSGALHERGRGDGEGTTLNLPMPAGTTGDVYRSGWDEVAGPALEAFAPDWLLLSAGFDAHRADPITDLGLSAGDYADLTTDIMATVPAGRRMVFLEGGYDLEALRLSSAACISALFGERHAPESPTSGGPGAREVEAVKRLVESS